jgi:hypothetical protein
LDNYSNKVLLTKKVPEPDERWRGRAAGLSQVKTLYRQIHFEIPKSMWQFGHNFVNLSLLGKPFAKMIQG